MTTSHIRTSEGSRENISLKTGTNLKRKSWLNICYKNNECFTGSKLVTLSFIAFTIAITISLIIQINYGDYQIVPHGSVATDSTECSLIGVDVLKKGGNAVDAAIASQICLSVVNPHTTGLDARGSMMIYSHRNRFQPELIDFSNESTINVDNLPLTRLLIGLVHAHLKYGQLSWHDLVKPAANLASQGFIVGTPFGQAVDKIHNAHKLFPNVVAGKNISLPALGSILHQIADISIDNLKQIKQNLLTTNGKVIKTVFENYNVYVPDNPTTGPILLENLQRISNLNATDVTKPEYPFYLAQILKKLYAEYEIDDEFHEGTWSNVAAVDTDDLYVSMVTGMYSLFGKQEMTPHGYLLDVVNSATTTKNINTRLPMIITDKKYICGRRIVLGIGDLSIASQIITNLVLGSENATATIERPRFHLINTDLIGIENSRKVKFTEAASMYLRSLSKIEFLSEPYSSCNIVEKTQDSLSSHSDSRGGGIAYRF